MHTLIPLAPLIPLAQGFGFCCMLLGASACVSIEGPTDPYDPWERYNRTMTKFNASVDKHLVKPVAKGYRKILPKPINKGLSNFFGNLGDVVILVNDILQLKPKSALSDLGRVIYNSTFGLAGFLDVATPMGLPKNHEDFGQTLGRWGIGKGPYFVLPVLGPSTVTDTFGLLVDFFVFDPANQLDSLATRASIVTVYVIDTRAGLLGADDIINAASLDPYIFVREAYLQRRTNLIYDGDPPEEQYED